MKVKNLIVLASLIVSLTGCAHFGQQHITWTDVQETAVVKFHDGTAYKNIIRIPVTVEWIAGDSLQVLDFDATYKNKVIEVTGEMRLPDDRIPAEKELIVYTDGSHPDVITIVYKNPNGETQVIQDIAIE
ncbi:hypothetical protein CA54_30880 [Symmachiella macrocystis]|uniref:Lipoprotein n=1 Tax=Symmachiella macrocystis TaxID=2527985 RepID=A0A5C6BQE8_9PLAN|nr:hypothetical protein [Symmachiella macrocystis]TWU14245.1 hypothetical protein CA54_30880 [Symmachiella macrocystis]